jgi:serine protease Do
VALKTSEFPISRADELAWRLLGIRVADLTPAKRKEFRIAAREGALVTEVRPGSQLARIAVRPGDVIRQIDDSATATHDEFRRAIVKTRHKSSLMLLIQRGEQGYYVTVSP